MVLVQNKYILNLLISTNKIKTLKNLPEIKTLILKVYYKKKTIYLIMTTFFILYFLVDKKPKLSSFDNIKKLELIIIKKKQCFKFLYNFYWLFFKYNNTYASKFNLKCYNKSNIRLFFYSLQNIFFEIFFFKMIQIGNWENLVFKLEFLFKSLNKDLNKTNLRFLFKGFNLIK